ncbi:hypothetical protein Scep_023406 [Stephania cephalantha]|uniref:Uncharacterized protein n=1 Tax=Stephania cephalantha TaxID=152367 RepID=A0AAP0HX95_9MAGN
MITASKSSDQLSGIRGVVKEALGVPFTKRKFGVVVVSLLIHVLFLSIASITTLFVRKELEAANHDKSKHIKAFISSYFLILVEITISNLTFPFGVILTVYHASDVYMGKSFSLKELLSRATATWKRRIFSFYQFGLYYLSIVMCLEAAFLFVSLGDYAAIAKVVAFMLIIAGDVLVVYMAAGFILGYVILIVEECDQLNILKAYEKSANLIDGKKAHADLTLFLLPVVAANSLLLFLLQSQNPFQAEILRYALAFILVVFIAISQPCIYILFTVFYYESMRQRKAGWCNYR